MKQLRATPLSCLMAAMSCLFGSAAYADFSYDFSTPPPATFTYSGVSMSGAASATFSSSVSGGMLRLRDSTPQTSGGTFLAKGDETSQVFTDVRATATLNPAGTSTNTHNVAVRNTPATGNTYVAGVDFRAGWLGVGKIMADRPVQLVFSSDPDQGSQPLLTDLDRSYFIQVDAIGNTVTARLFDSPGGTQLLQLHYTDTGIGGPAFTSGFTGVSAVETTSAVLDATFDNLTSTAVPEPGAAALAVFLGLALCQRRRSRRPSRQERPCAL